MKKYWCFLFHRKIWEIEHYFVDQFFDHKLYYCPKCYWYFYGNPFDPEEEK